MFNNLIESGPKQKKGIGGSVASTLAHAGIVFAMIVATKNVGETIAAEAEQVTKFVVEEKEPEQEPEKPPPDAVAAPPIAKGFQVLTAPVDIPDVIPEIDLSKKLTNEADFSGRGVAGGVASGVVGGSVVNQDQTFFDFQVEMPVAPIPGSGSPRYPEILLSAGVEGQVLGQFVVDTLGRVESGSFKVIRSDHDLFSAAVRSALPAMRFLPAEVGGRKVKQLVQQPFVFNRQR